MLGGDIINYQGDLRTPTIDITTKNCLFENVVSTPGWEFVGIDIKTSTLTVPING